MNRVLVPLLRGLVVVSVLFILLLQVAYLPWLSGEVARDLPAEAHLRWPILVLAVIGLLCVQVVLVCTFRLLGFIQGGGVFRAAALRWVDGIIGAFAGAGLVCLATIGYQLATVAGPPFWMLALGAGVLAGAGLASLVWVLRSLLVQATALRTEMDMVI